MNAKLKGLFKGLRYISSIFEEEKEEEIVIGLPTDVKHVAHVGWEGPPGGPSEKTVEAAPSWMKEFPATEAVKQSVKTNVGRTKETSEILYSEDSELKTSKSKSSSKDSQEMAKPTKRHPKELHDNTHNTNSPKKEKSRTSRRRSSKEPSENGSSSNKQLQVDDATLGPESQPRNSRRRSSKEPSENGGSSNKHLQVHDATLGPESSPSRNTTDVPKRLRRKKSKENQLDGDTGGHASGRSSRSKGKGHGVDHHGIDDRQPSSMSSAVSNDSALRTLSKEGKEYSRQVL